jgi:outer membrane protein assembly factor BamA
MPIAGGSAGAGVAVSAINASFYLGNPQTTKLSNILFYPTTNFDTRYQFKVFPNLWFGNNKWYVAGKFELSYMEQKTYGLGSNSPVDSLNIIAFNEVKLYEGIYRKIASNLFVGVGYALDNFYNIQEQWDKSWPSEFSQYEYGTLSNSFSSGLTFNVLYDSRKNIINPLGGSYLNIVYRINSSALGSDYNWTGLYITGKRYINFSHARHRTLAFWGLYWGNWGELPYLNMPGTALDYTGWTGRGYYRARYIGKQMLYAETEYRFDFTKSGLWGGVIFVNAQAYHEPDAERFRYANPAAGLGLRLKFNKYSDSNITFDVAFGKNSFNWYVALNEAF